MEDPAPPSTSASGTKAPTGTVRGNLWGNLWGAATQALRDLRAVLRPPKQEPRAFTPLPTPGPCPACAQLNTVTHGSDYPSRHRPFAALPVRYCTACGLGFVPGAGPVLADYYRADYAEANRGDRAVAPEVYFSEAHRQDPDVESYWNRVQSQLALLRRHGVPADLSGSHVLDFGSGPGYFLHASGAGHPYAFEPDEMSRKYLDHLGATQFTARGDIPEGRFGLIVASHSIEHLPAEELADTLATLLRALAPGGRLLVEVPAGGHAHLHLAGARQEPHTLFFTPEALWRALDGAARQLGSETGDAKAARIVFAGALGSKKIPRRTDPIYTPSEPATGAGNGDGDGDRDGDRKFFAAARGRLTVIVARA